MANHNTPAHTPITATAPSQQPPAEVLTIADRVTIHEARRHFERGGAVLVSEYGHEPVQTVYLDTTFHTRETVAWDSLAEQVKEWRGRYPYQRYYVLRPVDIAETSRQLIALSHEHALDVFNALLDEGVVTSEQSTASSHIYKLSRLLASAVALQLNA